jgi:hypothetical protein
VFSLKQILEGKGQGSVPVEMEEEFLEPQFQPTIFFKFIQGALDSIQRASSD